MTERVTRKTIEFLHPFELSGVEGVQPPGRYDIETLEETLDNLSFVAYRRISTTIELGASSQKRQLMAIDPDELAAAQERDAEASHATSQI